MANLTGAIINTQEDTVKAVTTSLIVASGVTVFEGALLSSNGSDEAILAVTGAKCIGVAMNSAVAGDKVAVRSQHVQEFPAALAAGNLLVNVYAGGDNPADVTLTPNTAVLGYIVEYTANGVNVLMTLDFRSNI